MFQLPVYNPHTPVLEIIELFSLKAEAFRALLNGRTFGELEDQDEVLLGLAIASELYILLRVADKFDFAQSMLKMSSNGRTPVELHKTIQAIHDAAKLFGDKLDANANISALIKSLQDGNEELEKLTAPSEQEQAA